MTTTCIVFEQGSERLVPLSDIGPTISGVAPGFVWIHLDRPSAIQIIDTAGRLGIPAEVANGISHPHQRPTMVLLDDFAVVVLTAKQSGMPS
ncbi:Mg2+ and Co2+ transporter CorA [Nakamurella sp. UYEF19]|uniref:hypothetical protein n=1 Tax=Nakamurella sp. UYEF19 TaxID=1756392 RepID=UPI0033970DDF